MAQYVSPKNGTGFQNGALLHSWAEWMDSYSGIIPRWEILFNLTVLRLISFNLDYYWSLEKGAGSALEVGHEQSVEGSHLILMRKRRNNSTLPIFPSEIAFQYLPRIRTTIIETTSHMQFMPLYI